MVHGDIDHYHINNKKDKEAGMIFALQNQWT